MLPAAPLIISCGSGAMKPLCASSNDVLSLKGSSFSSCALAAWVAAVAGLGPLATPA